MAGCTQWFECCSVWRWRRASLVCELGLLMPRVCAKMQQYSFRDSELIRLVPLLGASAARPCLTLTLTLTLQAYLSCCGYRLTKCNIASRT